MYPSTLQYRLSRSERMLRPAFGIAAALATALTLGLTVLAPAAAAPDSATTLAHVEVKHLIMAPTEVAILPAKIEVVATRTRAAQAPSPYRPASYKPRG